LLRGCRADDHRVRKIYRGILAAACREWAESLPAQSWSDELTADAFANELGWQVGDVYRAIGADPDDSNQRQLRAAWKSFVGNALF
jgi:hypothetical protein